MKTLRPALVAVGSLLLASAAAAQPVTAPPGAPADSAAPPPAGPPPPAAPPPTAAPAPGSAPSPGPPAPGPWEPPPPVAAPPPTPPPERLVSLTLSPVHLVLPVFEAKVEFMPTPHLGVGLIGGWGKISQSDGFTEIHARVWELGGQVVAYPLAPFDSLVVGIETLWVGLEVEEANVRFSSAAGNGLAVGPLVGYKWISAGGFTLSVQGGLYWGLFRAKVDGVKESDSDVGPLLNFDLGWSF